MKRSPLQDWRGQLKITQAQLAQRLGVSRVSVYLAETGQAEVPRALADLVGPEVMSKQEKYRQRIIAETGQKLAGTA